MSAPTSLELPAARLRRNRFWLGVAASPILGAFALAVAAWTENTRAPLVYAPFCLFLALFFTYHVWKDNPRPHCDGGTVTLGDDAISWNGELLARRDEIERASYHRESGAGTIVRLHRKRGADIQLLVIDDDAARHLVRALGFGAERTTAKFVGKSLLFSIPVWLRTVLFIAVFGLVGVLGAQVDTVLRSGVAFLGTYLIAALIALALRLAPTTIEVGADALSIGWLGLRRIVPLADVVDVGATGQLEHVRTFRGGSGTTRVHEAVSLATRGRSPTIVRFGREPYEIAQRDQLIERVREVQATRGRGEGAMDTAFLARGTRDVSAWIAALRAGAAPEGGMRTAPIPLERFWRLIEDASASAVDRAAAAVAVGRTASPRDRDRVRIAANQTVDPKLREALERAVDEQAEEEAVAEALEAVEKTAR